MKKKLFFVIMAVLLASCTATKNAEIAGLEDPPIITSASYQHTLYNGQRQSIDARAAKEVPLIVTYFRSEDELERNVGGTTEAPREVGVYYARIERAAFNGYRAGPPVKVEYRIQKPLTLTVSEQSLE
jgi:hypothetical protein